MITSIRAISVSILFCVVALSSWSASAATPDMQAASRHIMEKALATPKPEAAKFLLEQAIVADPANAAALSALGDLYVKMKNSELAMKYYEIALTVDPINVKALAGSARLDLAEGQKEKAAANLAVMKNACPTCRETGELEAALAQSK